MPLREAIKAQDKHAIASIVRGKSPLLSKPSLIVINDDQTIQIKKAREAVDSFNALWNDESDPSFLDVLHSIYKTRLFEIPERLLPIVKRSAQEQTAAQESLANSDKDTNEERDVLVDALDRFLLTSFSQIKPYVDYINQTGKFDTHQGVKGREFPRVMVIIDDFEARGFLFSYEKLFGAKEKSAGDIKNEKEGNETSHDRTRRLFYVTCSRAENSLAIVAYSENPQKVYDTVINEGWFDKQEVQIGL